MVKDIDFIVFEKEVPNYKDHLMNSLEELKTKTQRQIAKELKCDASLLSKYKKKFDL